MDTDDDLSPQPRGLEHVCLVDARHPPARGSEGDPCDPLDLLRAVETRVERAAVMATLVAEVDAAGQLAHDEQVGSIDALAAQRARVVEGRQRTDGAQVGEQAETLAQPEQPLLRSWRRR